MINILLVEDFDLVRTGIRMILEQDPALKVVAEASDGEQAIALARKLKPDVVLMDLAMPKMSGLEATIRILKVMPKAKIIILTGYSETPYPTKLLAAGAAGYLTKGAPAEELRAAVHEVYNGRRHIGHDIAQRLALSLLPGSDRSPFDELSGREMEVLLMFCRGVSATAVAKLLSLSPKTVSTYKARILEKLGVESQVEMLRLAIQHGIVESPGVDLENSEIEPVEPH